jgi:hypothetical protein
VANAFGATTSVVSGGLACIAGALVLARLLPAFRRQEAPAPQDAAELAAAGKSGQRSNGANRSPSRSTRSRAASAVKNRSPGARQDSTSSQLTGVDTVGRDLARSE